MVAGAAQFAHNAGFAALQTTSKRLFVASLLPWFALAREALQPVTKGFAACDAALRCEPGDEKVFTVSSCTQTHVDMML